MESLQSDILGVMLNKTFYKFLLGFLAVVASTLIFIFVVGSKHS